MITQNEDIFKEDKHYGCNCFKPYKQFYDDKQISLHNLKVFDYKDFKIMPIFIKKEIFDNHLRMCNCIEILIKIEGNLQCLYKEQLFIKQRLNYFNVNPNVYEDMENTIKKFNDLENDYSIAIIFLKNKEIDFMKEYEDLNKKNNDLINDIITRKKNIKDQI